VSAATLAQRGAPREIPRRHREPPRERHFAGAEVLDEVLDEDGEGRGS
jgi:hypothetical protein